MVDASYLPVTDKLIATIRTFSTDPFRYLVNTHSHPDHTGGNPNIVKQGALLLARETVREQLLQPLPPAARRRGVPNGPGAIAERDLWVGRTNHHPHEQ